MYITFSLHFAEYSNSKVNKFIKMRLYVYNTVDGCMYDDWLCDGY